MLKDFSYFNLKHTINNPLRIFFLCGSFFNTKGGNKLDKRIVLKKHIESLNPNYKCLILEENFLFRQSKSKLNYNDINMKSLKDIELLTSLMSDKVMIFHESVSTAAEIGLFSSDKIINDKMIILAPDSYSIEQDVISGFINLSYNNKVLPDYNIEIIRYYPGTYSYEISNNSNKIHTYFVNNVLGENLKSRLNNSLEISEVCINIEKQNKYNLFNNEISKYYVAGKELNVMLNIKHLVTLLTSLFSADEVKRKLREPISGGVDGSTKIKRKVLFKAISVIKSYFIEYIERAILSNNPTLRFEKIKISLASTNITFSQSVSYFIYVLYGINLIDINTTFKKLTIAVQFEQISEAYVDLIISPTNGGIAEVLNIE
ncbi:hypothetical protein ACIQLG_14070 [Terribacillus saccharophilus]|uniref:hypothetical protein n=1 Tax=Terribacillus saccharophilus TaxID=361277 RepID=UPI0037FE4EF4